MNSKNLDENYYHHQNSRSGMMLDSNELPSYYDKLNVNITPQFYFLDIGCRAHTNAVNFFYQKGAQSYGFDIGKEADKVWQVTRPVYLENLKVHDAHEEFKYTFQFDLISISHTLEHCHTPTKVLYNIWNALKVGGKVWGIVPVEKVTDDHAPHYCNFHSHQEHIKIYEQAGFEIVWDIESKNNSYIIAKKATK